MMPVTNAKVEHYTVERRLGSGSFGKVYLAYDDRTRVPVALKTEKKDDRAGFLQKEFEVYEKIGAHRDIYVYKEERRRKLFSTQQASDVNFFPAVFEFIDYGRHRIMSMQCLGKSLEEVMKESPKQRLPGAAVAHVGRRMIGALQVLHEAGYVHRDLKPHNMALGQETQDIYLFDMGLATPYVTNRKRHVVCRKDCSLVGTVRYSSLGTHLGLTQSRRDDLESLGYVLIYLACGCLPWQGDKVVNLKALDKVGKTIRNRSVMINKMNVRLEDLVSKIDDPALLKAVFDFMLSVRRLDFDSVPDYSFYVKLFQPFPDYTWTR